MKRIIIICISGKRKHGHKKLYNTHWKWEIVQKKKKKKRHAYNENGKTMVEILFMVYLNYLN